MTVSELTTAAHGDAPRAAIIWFERTEHTGEDCYHFNCSSLQDIDRRGLYDR